TMGAQNSCKAPEQSASVKQPLDCKPPSTRTEAGHVVGRGRAPAQSRFSSRESTPPAQLTNPVGLPSRPKSALGLRHVGKPATPPVEAPPADTRPPAPNQDAPPVPKAPSPPKYPPVET